MNNKKLITIFQEFQNSLVFLKFKNLIQSLIQNLNLKPNNNLINKIQKTIKSKTIKSKLIKALVKKIIIKKGIISNKYNFFNKFLSEFLNKSLNKLLILIKLNKIFILFISILILSNILIFNSNLKNINNIKNMKIPQGFTNKNIQIYQEDTERYNSLSKEICSKEFYPLNKLIQKQLIKSYTQIFKPNFLKFQEYINSQIQSKNKEYLIEKEENINLQMKLKKYNWCIYFVQTGEIYNILDGTSYDNINNGCGHFKETSYTSNGNVALAGHNRGYKVNAFRNLEKLKLNSKVIYKYNGEISKYRISEFKKIKEDDFSKIERKGEYLTLITCIKNVPNKRLCVTAIKIQE